MRLAAVLLETPPHLRCGSDGTSRNIDASRNGPRSPQALALCLRPVQSRHDAFPDAFPLELRQRRQNV
jgi:hypothetical protein